MVKHHVMYCAGRHVPEARRRRLIVQTTSTTSTLGDATCRESQPPEDAVIEPVQDPDAEARRQWLSTAAWPEIVFATT
jgi:hypothetical protein